MTAAFRSVTLIWLFIAASLTPSFAAIEIKKVVSKSGIKAWLVEDYTLPIIAMNFSFQGGATQDPKGKEGVARLLASSLDEGAGDLDSVAFQSRLEELGISMGFSASKDRFGGSLRTVRSEKQEAFDLLKMAINEPRFDMAALDRMKNAFMISLRRQETSPRAVGRKALREALFPGHPYQRPVSGTLESMGSLTAGDLEAMRKKILTRSGLVVGVVGAISEDELKTALDKIFAELPADGEQQEISDIKPKLGRNINIEMPTPNANITLVYKGLERSDPDFFAAYLANHILGGGTFSSRLYKAVREDRGLAYGVSSSLVYQNHAAYFIVGTSTRAVNRGQALNVIRDEVAKLVNQGITQQELEAAKRYVKGAYAINNLDSSGKIARVLVSLQTDNLGKDYINQRETYIDAVTLGDVNRVIKELLGVEPTQLVVAPPEG